MPIGGYDGGLASIRAGDLAAFVLNDCGSFGGACGEPSVEDFKNCTGSRSPVSDLCTNLACRKGTPVCGRG